MTELIAKEPKVGDKVYKEECAYCFRTPQDQDGLFVCLSKYVGLCKHHLDEYAKATGSKAFLNIKQQKVESDVVDEPEQKVKRLQVKIAEIKPKCVENYSVHLTPDLHSAIPYCESALGAELFNICKAVIAHNPASIQEQLEKGVSDWDGEHVFVSALAEDLVQLRIEKKIPYDGWTCEEPGCDRVENLWMNLSDGVIMCGRYVYGDPSSGKGHSEKHARETGFLLAVKLGTIQPDGKGDVYEYEFNAKGEDIGNTVKDPYLHVHLAHFGLDISKFEKREKTTLELELDLNYNFEYKVCQEEGANLECAYGPGLTGLVNLGSSCYINSVVQTLLCVPDFADVYLNAAQHYFCSKDPVEGQDDVNWQMIKLLHGMASGDYSKDSSSNGIRPSQFRRVMGRGHIEFSTAKQQDAEEYIRHLFHKIEANPIGNGLDPVHPFRFRTVTRLVDNASGRVRYAPGDEEEVVLALPVPMECAKKVPVESPRPDEPKELLHVSLHDCLERLFGEETIEGYISPVTQRAMGARQTLRMGSFPKFLILQIKRFVLEGLEPKKLDVNVQMDDVLDLDALRSQGLQPGEVELPSNTAPQTKDGVKEEEVQQLVDLGFTRNQAVYGLKKNTNNPNAAAEWLFENAHEVPEETTAPPSAVGKRSVSDGPGKYRLRGFITHMGKTVHSGHYVAHLEKDGVWYIFNDEKVAVSKRPPKAYGYLYLYERTT